MFIGFITFLTVGAAVGLSLRQTRIFEGQAPVLLQPRGDQSLFAPDAGVRLDPALAVDTEIEVLTSGPVRDEVEKKIGPVSPARANQVRQTLVIQVKARDRRPERAALAATTYAQTYIDLRRKQLVDQVLSAGQDVQAKIAEVAAEIVEVEKEEAAAKSSGAIVQNSLETRRQALLSQQALFRQKLDELEIDASVNAGGAQLLAPATTPRSPVQPKPVHDGVLGGIVGLLLGIGMASLFEALDDSIKTREELGLVAGDLPVLGAIPAFAAAPGLAERGSGAAEAYRSSRTAVQLLGSDVPVGLVQITSPGAGEGKTTTLSNLGAALAAAGLRVAMVDCDLRRPQLHEVFGLSNAVGVTTVLIGEVSVDAALQPVAGHDGLVCLPAGPACPNPSELLSSSTTGDLMSLLQSQFDIVLVDCPPVLAVTDATVVALWMEATILVAEAGKTTKRQLRGAIEQLGQVDGPLRGIVLNKANSEANYGYAYGYGYGERRSDRGEPAVNQAEGNGKDPSKPRRKLETKPERRSSQKSGSPAG